MVTSNLEGNTGDIMTTNPIGYAGNLLTITDSEVSEDWRWGFLRAAGRMMQEALPLDFSDEKNLPVAGSHREHIAGKDGMLGCPITEVYNFKEESGEDYPELLEEFHPEDLLATALASCACGEVQQGKVAFIVNPGEVTSYLMSHGE